MRIRHIIISAALLPLLSGCYDLNKEPEGVLSTANPFTSTGEMTSYLNQFYETGVKDQNFGYGAVTGIADGDHQSDNLATSAPITRINGTLTVAGSTQLTDYTYIRNVNFFLNNIHNIGDQSSAAYRQAVGEGYYFRAYYYFRLFKSYGRIAWVSKPLDPDLSEMQLPRENRTVIADSILADLDKAIANLPEQNSSATMRVHRDVARAFKSEVALYEATWEKYHKQKNDEFFDPTVTDAKIQDYLNQAVSAAKAVIDRGVWQVYSTGNPLQDYRVLFQTEDLSSNPEVLFFKHYDGANIGNNVDRMLNEGGGTTGVTASLVDDYLTRDGRPFVGTEKDEAKKVYGRELSPELRDPRLGQTVVRPGQQLRPDEGPYTVPPLNGSAYKQNVTGYSILKHVQIDYTGNLDAEYKGATPGIQYRYADILLNYAEALAELGGAQHASEIVAALHPLRARVGMPDVDFDREYNTDADYPFRSLDKYVQAVRRERRVETALEGKRFDDIARWAAADVLLVGKRPVGALFIGSDLENAYGGTLKYDQASGNNIFLTGKAGDSERYILPYDSQDGWQFNVHRDYLLPLQPRMISLTGGLWEQNPGW